MTCDAWCTLTIHIRKFRTLLLLPTHSREVSMSVFRCQGQWFGFPYNCPLLAVKWTKTKILTTHEWEKTGGCTVLREKVGDTGNDLLVNTLPYASPTLQGMLPTTAHFYFPDRSSLPCSVTINHCHAALCLFKKAFQTVQKWEDKI